MPKISIDLKWCFYTHDLTDSEAAYTGPDGPHKVLWVYIMTASLVFIGFLSVWTSGSLILVPSFVSFSFCLFVLSNSNIVLGFVLFYFIILHCIIIPWVSVCFPKRDRKAVGLERRGCRMELGGTEEEKTIIKTNYVRKNMREGKMYSAFLV